MTKNELLEGLRECEINGDVEAAHSNADDLLIEYINDEDIKDAYENVEKWYA